MFADDVQGDESGDQAADRHSREERRDGQGRQEGDHGPILS
jgi:hypothetical protein